MAIIMSFIKCHTLLRGIKHLTFCYSFNVAGVIITKLLVREAEQKEKITVTWVSGAITKRLQVICK